ncbi:MAG TPA: DUF962 domain-containing protein [Polyangia bacterium]|jgi:uncharacterized membrane protein YGL010W
MALLSTRSWDDWVSEYAQSHSHPTNRFCHTIGIPMIALSMVVFVAGVAAPKLWWLAAALFGVGWIFQFIGHAFERKAPEFLKGWRFFFVGLGWWMAKVRGRA